MCKLQEHLWERFEGFESLDSFEKTVVSCGKMTLALCLILFRITFGSSLTFILTYQSDALWLWSYKIRLNYMIGS